MISEKVNDINQINDIVDFFEKETQSYFNKIYPDLKHILIAGREKHNHQIDFLYHLYIFQNYLIDYQTDYFKKESSLSITTFYNKTASDSLCIYECLRQGQLISAMSIERNIFESYVNLKLILEEDTEYRIKLYEEFGYVRQWNRIEEYQNYLERLKSNPTISKEEKDKQKDSFDKLFDKKIIETTRKNYQKIKDNYHPRRPYKWYWKIFKDKKDNPSLLDICKKLNIEYEYLQTYGLNSIVVHSDPPISNLLTQRDQITSAPNFNENIKRIAATSSSIIIKIIVLTLEYANSPSISKINDYLIYKWLNIY